MVAADELDRLAEEHAELRPMTAEEAAARASLAWFEGERLDTYLTRAAPAHPLCWRAPDGEFLIGGQWRRRTDIVCIIELRAARHIGALLARFMRAARAVGARLVVPAFEEMDRSGPLYHRAGFEVIDEILRFERLGLSLPPAESGRLAELSVRAFDPASSDDLAALVAIDHAAFPWLWWNSEDELRWYTALRGSGVLFSLDGQRPVGYAGFSLFHDDGHLDRLAVLPEFAGRGHGTSLLRHTFSRLKRLGARGIALTTQGNNERAQRLYRRFGFRRTGQRYRIYGRWLADPPADRVG